MLLALCIPTYNRSKYLEDCLISIIDDIREFAVNDIVQICISDNNSTDDTTAMINRYSEAGNINIRYHKNLINIGADLNYLKCVEIADADYCWLMGSDDTIVKGSIPFLLKEIAHYKADVYLANRRLCDIDMVFLRNQEFFFNQDKTLYHFADKEELKCYLNNSKTLGCVFSYLSSIILKTEKWRSVTYNESYTGTAYSHVFIILSFLLRKESRIRIVHQVLVNCRMGNDAFLEEGSLKRFMIDINGYSKLAQQFFSTDEELKREFLNILKREHTFVPLLKVRMATTADEWITVKTRLKQLNFSKKVLNKVTNIPRFTFLFIKTGIKIKNVILKR